MSRSIFSAPPRALGALLLSTSVLTACASVPDLGAPPQPKPATSYLSAQILSAPESAWPEDTWWQAYGDPQLTRLIVEALTGSPDLAVAEARVRQAEALAQQAGAALGPQLQAEASVAAAKQSYNNGVPADFVPHGWNDSGRVGANLSWQLDFFGRNRASLAAATSQAQAARAEAAAARLTLSTAVASAYADLAQLHADRDAADQAVRVRRQTEDLISQRRAQGLENRSAEQRAHAARAAAEADLAAVDEALGLTRNRIAALTGQGPDRGIGIDRPAQTSVRAFGLPANLQADLVGRRPDVTAARLRAEAAAKRIKVARADFYPNLNLTAFLGVQSLGLDLLTKSGSTVGQVGPAVSLPIFDSGRLQGAFRGARAEYDEAVASYDQTLARALNDVADAAVSARALDARLAKSREALAASVDAHKLAQDRYRGGLATYLDVLSAEDALIANRRTVADLEARAFSLDVELVRALGGGFHA
ncbi:efflux transporter outer membrane subunit [Phenylobacterium sp.]|jgi:NodT family efflux transporter outer membrane factor (OMF) lipoprotein|uniref:efflux transporter outer membrane subunit n=1 Tax=Phenylobacterium sp. TaxID=1871053 RepID=UPI002F93271A